jgi:type IV secretion system protein VirB3
VAQLDRDTLFVALARPQMFAGVTYGFFVINVILTTELFLILKSGWVLLGALILHGVGYLASLREPRIVDIWLVKVSRCSRIPNYRLWRCNSYQP